MLKTLLQGPANSVLEQISGMQVARWLPVELPKVQNPRMDLLGESAGGDLIHIELQSTNEGFMALRMAEYFLGVYRKYRRFPRQILLYVGEPELRMDKELKGPRLAFDYEMVDIRELDGEQLLESPWLSDNVIGILGRLSDRREAVRRVLRRISQLSGEARVWRLSSSRYWQD